MKSFRQGDVYLKQVEVLPELEDKHYFSTESKPESEDKSIVLAYGESTGHKHAIYDGNAILMRQKNSDKFYLIIVKTSELKHEEHDPISLPVGNYEVVHQREYTPTQIRRVID